MAQGSAARHRVRPHRGPPHARVFSTTPAADHSRRPVSAPPTRCRLNVLDARTLATDALDLLARLIQNSLTFPIGWPWQLDE